MTVGMLIFTGVALWICVAVAVLGWKLVNHLEKEVPMDGSQPPTPKLPQKQKVKPPSSGET